MEDPPSANHDQIANLRCVILPPPRTSQPPDTDAPRRFAQSPSRETRCSRPAVQTQRRQLVTRAPQHMSRISPCSPSALLRARLDWSEVQQTRVNICDKYMQGSPAVRRGMLRDVLIVMLHSITPPYECSLNLSPSTHRPSLLLRDTGSFLSAGIASEYATDIKPARSPRPAPLLVFSFLGDPPFALRPLASRGRLAVCDRHDQTASQDFGPLHLSIASALSHPPHRSFCAEILRPKRYDCGEMTSKPRAPPAIPDASFGVMSAELIDPAVAEALCETVGARVQ